MVQDYFVIEMPEYHPDWDRVIKFASVPDRLDWKQLLERLPCGNTYIELPFEWDGSSSGPFRFLVPKWRHPIASARHDKRCRLLREMLALGMISKQEANKLRKIADMLYRADIHIGQESTFRGSAEAFIGYVGVRFGALLGIGLRQRRDK